MPKNTWQLPAVCDLSVANLGNAACGFCGFARDKGLAGPARPVQRLHDGVLPQRQHADALPQPFVGDDDSICLTGQSRIDQLQVIAG